MPDMLVKNDAKRDAPRSVRLIPIVKRAFERRIAEGYTANHQINLALAIYLGIPIELVLPYFRGAVKMLKPQQKQKGRA